MTEASKSSNPFSRDAVRIQQFSINLSLIIGFLMLAGKWYAYLLTGSAAILSDAAESVVHVIAVSFAVFSLWLSHKPADESHPYGHDRISFFSAGVEGTFIILAALVIIYEALNKLITGIELTNLGQGTLFVTGAALLNAGLGGYLVWQGKRQQSLILVANGKHVLTDSWTSFGVIVGLLLVLWTEWKPFDPIMAILVALNILWSGGRLVRQSIGGLMDEGSPQIRERIQEILNEETSQRGLRFHEVRYRNAGNRLWIEFHLLFPTGTTIEEAHWKATEIEARIKTSFGLPVNILTHLEPVEDHDRVHKKLKDSSE